MKRKLLVVISLTTVFCVLAVLAGYAMGLRTPSRGVGFTLRSKFTHYQPDGTTLIEEVTRYESRSGSWREVRLSGGNVNEQFFRQGDGFFSVDHRRQRLIRSEIASKTRNNIEQASAEELLSSAQFNRTEFLLDHTAFVMQIRDGDTLMSEVYVVPEFGRTPVKYVSFDTAGRVISVKEPESVTLGEPAAADLKGPDYVEVPTKEPGRNER